jgi:hypothetical protein
MSPEDEKVLPPPGDVEVAPVEEAKVVDDVVEDNGLFKVDGEVQYRTMGWMKVGHCWVISSGRALCVADGCGGC